MALGRLCYGGSVIGVPSRWDQLPPSVWPRPARERITQRGCTGPGNTRSGATAGVWAMIEAQHAATQSTTLRLLRVHELTLPIDDLHPDP